MLRLRHSLPWTMGAAAAFLAGACHAQGNIDAGKSPAQIFADTCAVCHRDAREMRRSSAAFLRQHYTSSYEEAAAMAGYLARLPSEPRAAQPRRPPASVGPTPAENAKQQPRQQPAGADQAKSANAQSKSRRPGATAEARPALKPPVEENPPAPAAAATTPVPAPAKPVLETFQE